MLRALPLIIALVLAVFSLVDLTMSPRHLVRNLPKWTWFLVILVPFAGPIAWLTAGRPKGDQGTGGLPSRPARPVAPDDDPEFLAGLERKRQHTEQERLEEWQAELERREQELGQGDRPDDDDGTGRSTT